MIDLKPPPRADADEEAVRGWSGVKLDREGVKGAHEIGRDLKGRGIGMFICSSIARAVQTAEILSKESGVPISSKSPDLNTWDVGEIEGSGLADSEKILRYYVLKAPNDKPKGGESFNNFAQRALRKIKQIMDLSIKHNVIIGIITHHWVVDIVLRWIEAGAPDDLSFDRKNILWDKEDPPGTVYDMRVSNGKWSMPKVPAGTDFHPGPVIIRHEQTSMN